MMMDLILDFCSLNLSYVLGDLMYKISSKDRKNGGFALWPISLNIGL